jgi:hypothetical protein
MYDNDLCDEEWGVIRHHFQRQDNRGAPSGAYQRHVINAILTSTRPGPSGGCWPARAASANSIGCDRPVSLRTWRSPPGTSAGSGSRNRDRGSAARPADPTVLDVDHDRDPQGDPWPVGGVHVEMARGKIRETENVREPLLTRHGGRSCARPVGHVGSGL